MKFKISFLVYFFVGYVLTYGQERKLIWEENFDGSKLENKNWNILTGDGCPNLCGWGNNERQIYTSENHELANGFLKITARKDGNKYTSTRINTKGKKEFKYGKIEMRAQLPTGKGIWPAFWMLGSNINKVGWPLAGEIDILEYVGKEPETIFTTLHTKDSHGASKNTRKDVVKGIEEGFHTFAIDWSKDKIVFLVDGNVFYTFSPENKDEKVWPFDQPFYIIVNMAIGGSFGGPEVDDSIFPQEFIIDYIKVYQ